MKRWLTVLLQLGFVAPFALSAGSCSDDENLGNIGGGGSDSGGASGSGGGDSGGSDAGGAGGAPESGGGSGGAPMSLVYTLLGAPCTADSECDQPDGVCVTETNGLWGDQGPGGGYCTVPCDVPPTATDPDACLDNNGFSLCLALGPDGEGYCTSACNQGTPADVTTKCQGRADVRCGIIDTVNLIGLCFATCGDDLDCAGGTCDLFTGLCGEPISTDSVGDACDADAVTPTCPCFRLRAGEPDGVCVGFCTLGSSVACGSAAAPRDAVCVSTLAADGGLDEGLCLSSCDCNDDCIAGTVCQASTAAGQADIGHAGFCVPALNPPVLMDAGTDAGVEPTTEGIPVCP